LLAGDQDKFLNLQIDLDTELLPLVELVQQRQLDRAGRSIANGKGLLVLDAGERLASFAPMAVSPSSKALRKLPLGKPGEVRVLFSRRS
jgi:hypothetical protein